MTNNNRGVSNIIVVPLLTIAFILVGLAVVCNLVNLGYPDILTKLGQTKKRIGEENTKVVEKTIDALKLSGFSTGKEADDVKSIERYLEEKMEEKEDYRYQIPKSIITLQKVLYAAESKYLVKKLTYKNLEAKKELLTKARSQYEATYQRLRELLFDEKRGYIKMLENKVKEQQELIEKRITGPCEGKKEQLEREKKIYIEGGSTAEGVVIKGTTQIEKEVDDEQKKLEMDITVAETRLKRLKEIGITSREMIEIAGVIKTTNRKENKVFISIGANENVPLGIVFRVFQFDKFGARKWKGSVRVIKVYQEHSLVQILEENYPRTDPITDNDYICNIFFNPRRTVTVTLVGSFRKEMFGFSKSELINQLQRLGVNVEKEVSLKTTFVIAGVGYEESDLKTASELSVPVISYEEIIPFIGVPLGAR